MAFKFAAYETLRGLHSRVTNGRNADVTEDFAMGAIAGAFAAGRLGRLGVGVGMAVDARSGHVDGCESYRDVEHVCRLR